MPLLFTSNLSGGTFSSTPTALPYTNKIDINSSKTVAFREISIQYGDGYKQVAPDGINAKKESWEVIWGALTIAERDAIESLLDSNGTWGIFSWTPCNDTTSKLFRVTKDGYTRKTLGSNGTYSISCKLEQCFNV